MKMEVKLILKELNDIKSISLKKIEELKEATISIYGQNLKLLKNDEEKDKIIEKLEKELAILRKK